MASKEAGEAARLTGAAAAKVSPAQRRHAALVTGTNVVKWYCALSLEEECESYLDGDFSLKQWELEYNC